MKRWQVRMLTVLMCMMLLGVTAQAKDVPYTVELEASEKIYEGHGVEFEVSRRVEEDGVYTVVEEAYDQQGSLWGRLKSGAGWVRLTDAVEYTVSLDVWVPIYDRPDEMEAVCVGIVGEDGEYTMVSEVQDSLGNVWGELKSGAGWVNLNYVRYMGKPPMTAYYADVVDALEADQCDFVLDDSEGMVRIAFRANEKLGNVRFSTLQNGDTYAVEETHCQMQQMEAGEYFVAGVVFYGDMTAYGISFEDSEGTERHFAVYVSGMNGSLVMDEYVP